MTLERTKSVQKQDDELNEASSAHLKKRLVELFETTTCHAIPNAVRSPNNFLRASWILMFALSLSYSIYSVIETILAYLEFSVLLNYELKAKYNDFDYPIVTICNQNPFADSFSNQSNLKKAYSYFAQTFDNTSFYLVNNNSTLCTTQNFDDAYLSFTNMKGRDSYGMPFDRLLINCTFNNKKCAMLSDELVNKAYTSGFHGKCYSIQLSSFKVRRAGIQNGLRMELFVGEQEYQPCWYKTRGFLVTIHDKNYRPMYIEEGINIQPGVETSFILTRYEYRKMPAPFSNCIQNLYNSSYSKYVQMTIQKERIYQPKFCLMMCTSDLNTMTNRASCAAKNDSSLSCLNNADNIDDFYEQCFPLCPLECEYNVLSIQSAYAEYPSENYAQALINDPRFVNKFSYSKNFTFKRVKSCVAAFNVYFSTINVHSYVEYPAMTFDGLLSNFGGTLGLFLG